MLQQADVRKMLVSGDQWGSWRGYQLPLSEEYVTIWTPLGTEMHWMPGTWISTRHSISYFWAQEWYTLHIFYNQEGAFHSAYCDVVLPQPSYSNTAREVIYTDLYIDVVVREDGSVYTKDREVFDRASLYYPIVEESRQKAFEVLDWLELQARAWSGPFAIIPRQLPRTDFEKLQPDEARAAMSDLPN